MPSEERAEDFKVAKASPIKRFAEEPTFLRAVGDLSGKSVLDLACGSGFYTRALKRQGASRVVGVDISGDMIASARAEEESSALGIEYVQSDVLQMQTLGTFDVVTAAYLFVYADTLEVLRSMCDAVERHLAPGGQLVASMIHPRLSIGEQMPMEKTGGRVELVAEGPLADGAALTVTIGDGQDTYRVRDYFWSEATYERSFADAGLAEVVWHTLVPSEEGRERLGAEFWDEYLRNPSIAVVSARRAAAPAA